jgi:hypothetical protein
VTGIGVTVCSSTFRRQTNARLCHRECAIDLRKRHRYPQSSPWSHQPEPPLSFCCHSADASLGSRCITEFTPTSTEISLIEILIIPLLKYVQWMCTDIPLFQNTHSITQGPIDFISFYHTILDNEEIHDKALEKNQAEHYRIARKIQEQ